MNAFNEKFSLLSEEMTKKKAEFIDLISMVLSRKATAGFNVTSTRYE